MTLHGFLTILHLFFFISHSGNYCFLCSCFYAQDQQHNIFPIHNFVNIQPQEKSKRKGFISGWVYIIFYCVELPISLLLFVYLLCVLVRRKNCFLLLLSMKRKIPPLTQIHKYTNTYILWNCKHNGNIFPKSFFPFFSVVFSPVHK